MPPGRPSPPCPQQERFATIGLATLTLLSDGPDGNSATEFLCILLAVMVELREGSSWFRRKEPLWRSELMRVGAPKPENRLRVL
jgi:hypothetical protein